MKGYLYDAIQAQSRVQRELINFKKAVKSALKDCPAREAAAVLSVLDSTRDPWQTLSYLSAMVREKKADDEMLSDNTLQILSGIIRPNAA